MKIKTLKNHFIHLMKSHLFTRIFLASILFMIIPIILFFTLFYFDMFGYMKQRINESNLSHLSSIQQNTDSILRELKSKSIFISANEYVEDYFSIKTKKKKYVYYENARNVMNILSNITLTTRYIHSIYLYDEHNQAILTSNGEFYKDPSEFHDTVWMNNYQDNKNMIQLLSERNPINPGFLEANKRIDPKWNLAMDIKANVITYIYPYKLYPNDTYEGALLINVNKESLLFANENSHTTNNLMIIDKKGNIISNQIEAAYRDDTIIHTIVEKILVNSKESTKDYITTHIGHRNLMLTQMESSVKDLIFVKITNVDILYSKIEFYKFLILLLSFLLPTLGIIASYKLAINTYNPIKNTLSILNIPINKVPKERRNELNMLSNAVNEVMKESKKLSNIVEGNKEGIKQSYVMELIRGNLKHLYHLFPEKQTMYITLVLSIDHYKEFSYEYDYLQQSYLKKLLMKVTENIASRYLTGVSTMLERSKVALIVGGNVDDIDTFKNRLNTIINDILNQTSLIKEFSFSIGVGNVYKKSELIRDSYIEANEALKYKIITGHNSVIYYDALSTHYKKYYSSVSAEKHIINNLSSNHYSEINSIFDTLIEELQNTDNVSYENIMQIFYSILSKIYEYLEEKHINKTEVFGGDYTLTEDLLQMETLDDIKSLMLDLCKNIIAYQKQTSIDDDKHMQQILDCIEKNYTDSDFSITTLVDDVGITYPNIRRIILKKTGFNYTKYLNSIRISKSKELLTETQLTIKEIANKVGYNNDQSFTRYFKKYEGTTPGEYRKHHQ